MLLLCFNSNTIDKVMTDDTPNSSMCIHYHEALLTLEQVLHSRLWVMTHKLVGKLTFLPLLVANTTSLWMVRFDLGSYVHERWYSVDNQSHHTRRSDLSNPCTWVQLCIMILAKRWELYNKMVGVPNQADGDRFSTFLYTQHHVVIRKLLLAIVFL